MKKKMCMDLILIKIRKLQGKGLHNNENLYSSDEKSNADTVFINLTRNRSKCIFGKENPLFEVTSCVSLVSTVPLFHNLQKIVCTEDLSPG